MNAPDIKFIQRLKKESKADFKSCMQCGTCSVVCSLSPETKPFPRKEMMAAAWGLKDQLMGNPDVWLCHQCGECSANCPRDVKPATVLASVRRETYVEFARPAFMGKLLTKPGLLPIVILIPLFIISLVMIFADHKAIPKDVIDYSKFFPHALINSSFSILLFISLLGAFTGLRAFWKKMKINMPGETVQRTFSSFLTALKDLFIHKNFRSCSSSNARGSAHFLMFWGFIILLCITAVAIINVVLLNYPMQLLHPAKIVGNLAALMVVIGTLIMIIQRIGKKGAVSNSSYFDWFFLLSLFFLALTGILTEWARFANWSLAYYIYFTHLINVWIVILYLPYTKFAHIFYRIAALTYANSIGRNLRK